jgi:7,8-dihydroneopterin aldolase/epimerase/oxygenase
VADRIVIERIHCRTQVGFQPHEQGIDQDLYVTVRIESDLAPAAHHDEVDHGVDYREVTKRVKAAVEGHKQNLIETVAERVAALCLAFPRVAAVEVRVEKPGALTDADNVWVEMRRGRAAIP